MSTTTGNKLRRGALLVLIIFGLQGLLFLGIVIWRTAAGEQVLLAWPLGAALGMAAALTSAYLLATTAERPEPKSRTRQVGLPIILFVVSALGIGYALLVVSGLT